MQDNSSLWKPPNKRQRTFWTAETSFFPILPSLLSRPSPSLRFISMADGFAPSCGPTVLSWCEPNPSGTQYPVYQLSALWKPQQYWAEAEVQNSLQFVQVTAKVEVFSFSVTLRADSLTAAFFFSFSFCNLYMFSCHALWANLPESTSEAVMAVRHIIDWAQGKMSYSMLLVDLKRY